MDNYNKPPIYWWWWVHACNTHTHKKIFMQASTTTGEWPSTMWVCVCECMNASIEIVQQSGKLLTSYTFFSVTRQRERERERERERCPKWMKGNRMIELRASFNVLMLIRSVHFALQQRWTIDSFYTNVYRWWWWWWQLELLNWPL